MACQAFDAQVAHHEGELNDLLSRFICVRMVQANGADLSLFQFDYDLTFAAFFLNADRTIYGRFGSRSANQEAMRDMSMEGFRKALEAALELHRQYPANKTALAGKQPRPAQFQHPEDFPALHRQYNSAVDFSGKLGKSCIHCHMVRGAERLVYRQRGEPMPIRLIYPWPMPDALGLHFDAGQKATLQSVATGSAGAKAGFEPGDRIVTLAGQPMLSIADVQWVLETAPGAATVKANVLRHGQALRLDLPVSRGWRRSSDISWRPTSWDLRRMATGGMLLETLNPAERESAGLAKGVGLRVKYLGEYGDHAVGLRAGFRKGDILVRFDGREEPMTESELMGYVLEKRMPGAKVPVTILRNGQEQELELRMQ